MNMLPLALEAGLPLIYVRTDDTINVGQVLDFIAGEECRPVTLPVSFEKVSDITTPKEGRIFYTSSECKSLKKLYLWAVDMEKTIIFVNTEKSVLHFDGGTLVPPSELVESFLSTISENSEELLPSFGGLTLKDVGEIAKLTMTRDESLTIRGVNKTRRGYHNLKGISPIDTAVMYYLCPSYLGNWLKCNTEFFLNPIHDSLTPRGLLLDGKPGTGKTMASKHVAATLGVPLYHLDIGALKGKYVGESEGNFLAALNQADMVEPCVILIDEVEKIFQTQGDSGVTTSLLSQLLWWLQEHKTRVLTIMTTNDINAIPEELYREGRVDEVMGFMGIETFTDGLDFATGAFNSMCDSLKDSITASTLAKVSSPAVIKTLDKTVKRLYSDGLPVPQSKLTQETYALIKQIIGDQK